MTSAVALDQLCVNTIRTLAIDAVQKASSGHPGLPMGAAPMAYVLWQRHLRHQPQNPDWPNRDRFVLSAGHGSMLLYALLHLTGYDVTIDDLKAFRQWGSRTPGHPESFETPGVEATTGPLGQGSANAVGMALAGAGARAPFQPALSYHRRPHHLRAGLGWRSHGGNLRRSRFVCRSPAPGEAHLSLRCQRRHLDGPASLTFTTEDVGRRYQAYGWQVLQVQDGDTDLEAIDAAIQKAREETTRPSIVIVKTTIGYGSPNKQGSSSAHGSPLGADEVTLTKESLGWDAREPFYVPEEAKAQFVRRSNAAEKPNRNGTSDSRRIKVHIPSLRREWERRFSNELPAGWEAAIPSFEAGDNLATREASGKVPERDCGGGAGASRRRCRSVVVDQDGAQRHGLVRRSDRYGSQPSLRRARARDGKYRQRHGVPRRRPRLCLDVFRVLRLHAAGGCVLRRSASSRRSTCGRMIRSVWVKTVPPTSRWSISWRFASFPTCT